MDRILTVLIIMRIDDDNEKLNNSRFGCNAASNLIFEFFMSFQLLCCVDVASNLTVKVDLNAIF